MKKYLIEIVVFFAGAAVMAFELVSSRLLAPYVGTSMSVWTAIIGIFLGSLSFGYYYGGRLSDRHSDNSGLAAILMGAFLSLVYLLLVKPLAVLIPQYLIPSFKLSSIILSIILFVPANIFLGMVSPYAAKLKINNLASSGSTVGRLSALSTLGSIIGTFSAGYFLIPFLGTDKIIILIAIIILILSLALDKLLILKSLRNIFSSARNLIILVFVLVIVSLVGGLSWLINSNSPIDIDTAYQKIKIVDSIKNNRPVRYLVTGPNAAQSAMYLDSYQDAADYTVYYDLAGYFFPKMKNALMLGGAGYLYPRHFVQRFQDVKLDVVEIDPGMTKVATQYFNFKPDSRISIYHEDGRVFLNRSEKKYDAIFGDAFSSYCSIPYQLTTREAVVKHYESLNEGGVAIINIISALSGDKAKFLQAEYATYKDVFPQVFLFKVGENSATEAQNLILVALKSSVKPNFSDASEEFSPLLDTFYNKFIFSGKILTDQLAPVDYYVDKL